LVGGHLTGPNAIGSGWTEDWGRHPDWQSASFTRKYILKRWNNTFKITLLS